MAIQGSDVDLSPLYIIVGSTVVMTFLATFDPLSVWAGKTASALVFLVPLIIPTVGLAFFIRSGQNKGSLAMGVWIF